MGRSLHEDGGRNQNDVAMKNAKDCLLPPEAGREAGSGFFLTTSGRANPADTLVLASWPPEL